MYFKKQTSTKQKDKYSEKNSKEIRDIHLMRNQTNFNAEIFNIKYMKNVKKKKLT